MLEHKNMQHNRYFTREWIKQRQEDNPVTYLGLGTSTIYYSTYSFLYICSQLWKFLHFFALMICSNVYFSVCTQRFYYLSTCKINVITFFKDYHSMHLYLYLYIWNSNRRSRWQPLYLNWLLVCQKAIWQIGKGFK